METTPDTNRPFGGSHLLTPGSRVTVTQQVPRLGNGDATGSARVTGTVIAMRQMKTGSWYAHSRGDKLWLDRLELVKDDGERVFLNLDQYTSVEEA